MTNSESFFTKGWIRFDPDPVIKNWADHTLKPAVEIINKDEHKKWLRCGGTWFAGVNVLENDSSGHVGNGPALAGNCIDFIREEIGIAKPSWDRGQISVCYPGYPKPMQGESKSAFNYRLNRDAAHVDGLLPEGLSRHRHLREYHGFILGIPLVESSPQASPLVVWEGSHEIIREAFKKHFSDYPPQSWGDLDVTQLYQNTRVEIFDQCKRVELFANHGQAYIIHRLALHGIAPWKDNSWSFEHGRMICYFRPDIAGPWQWLNNR